MFEQSFKDIDDIQPTTTLHQPNEILEAMASLDKESSKILETIKGFL